MLWALFRLKSGWSGQELGAPFLFVTCARRLAAWAKGSRCMPFAIPMVSREPTDHVSDCYFYLTSITGVTTTSKHTVHYPNLLSAMRPVAHSAALPVPEPPTNMTLSDCESSDEYVGQTNNNMDCDPTFQESILPVNHTCWLKGTWMISSAILTCQRSKLKF